MNRNFFIDTLFGKDPGTRYSLVVHTTVGKREFGSYTTTEPCYYIAEHDCKGLDWYIRDDLTCEVIAHS